MTTRRYALLPSLPDPRDFVLDVEHLLFGGVPLPQRATLKQLNPVRDQGAEGSCTGFSLTAALAALKVGVFSPAFLYYAERVIERDPNQDAGANLRDGLKSLQKQGVCIEDLMPYIAGHYADPPAAKALADAPNNTIRTYARVPGSNGVRAAIAFNRPVVLGITVMESFERIGADGLCPTPAPGERVMGGHAILACGYDDAARRVTLQNSWGAAFGDKGYVHMPYAMLDDPHYTFEAWSIAR